MLLLIRMFSLGPPRPRLRLLLRPLLLLLLPRLRPLLRLLLALRARPFDPFLSSAPFLSLHKTAECSNGHITRPHNAARKVGGRLHQEFGAGTAGPRFLNAFRLDDNEAKVTCNRHPTPLGNCALHHGCAYLLLLRLLLLLGLRPRFGEAERERERDFDLAGERDALRPLAAPSTCMGDAPPLSLSLERGAGLRLLLRFAGDRLRLPLGLRLLPRFAGERLRLRLLLRFAGERLRLLLLLRLRLLRVARDLLRLRLRLRSPGERDRLGSRLLPRLGGERLRLLLAPRPLLLAAPRSLLRLLLRFGLRLPDGERDFDRDFTGERERLSAETDLGKGWCMRSLPDKHRAAMGRNHVSRCPRGLRLPPSLQPPTLHCSTPQSRRGIPGP